MVRRVKLGGWSSLNAEVRGMTCQLAGIRAEDVSACELIVMMLKALQCQRSWHDISTVVARCMHGCSGQISGVMVVHGTPEIGVLWSVTLGLGQAGVFSWVWFQIQEGSVASGMFASMAAISGQAGMFQVGTGSASGGVSGVRLFPTAGASVSGGSWAGKGISSVHVEGPVEVGS